MKIHIIAALHGDELFGLKVLSRLHRCDDQDIRLRVGNLEAIAKHKRYIDSDLNRSFGASEHSNENVIAEDICKEVKDFAPDLVLDLHTSKSNIGKVAIVAKNNTFIEQVAKQLGLDAIVIMPEYLTNTSLIGVLPDISISIELGRNFRSDKLASELAEKIKTLDTHKQNNANSLPKFRVYKQINKKFSGLGNIQNLKFNKQLGGYPFLAGANTYQDFGGFLAKKLT